MKANTTTCDKFVNCPKCNKQYTIGQSPFCRDNHEGGGRFGFGPFTPHDDDMIGTTDPVHFGNWGEKLRYMDRNGIEAVDLSHKRYGKTLYSR